MNTALSFDDVLMVPKFTKIESRKNVDTRITICGTTLTKAIISSNMDTVTSPKLANAMFNNGALACLHRFQSIEDNIKQYKQSPPSTWVSIGLGDKELARAQALYDNGAKVFLIDVANAASDQMIDHVKKLRYIIGNTCYIIVGNFATGKSLQQFKETLGETKIDAVKIGIGGGSACLTRVVTGFGLPTFASIIDCQPIGYPMIADGGIRNSSDYSKALAAGATAVMCGKLFAGTDESASELIETGGDSWDQETRTITHYPKQKYKKYRGSASAESYDVQGKTASHRSYEGDSFLVPYVGETAKVLQQMDGGLRSAMTYCNAKNLEELQKQVEFVIITQNGLKESGSHGKL